MRSKGDNHVGQETGGNAVFLLISTGALLKNRSIAQIGYFRFRVTVLNSNGSDAGRMPKVICY